MNGVDQPWYGQHSVSCRADRNRDWTDVLCSSKQTCCNGRDEVWHWSESDQLLSNALENFPV